LVEVLGEAGIEAIWIAQRLDDVDVIEGHHINGSGSSLYAALQAKVVTGVPSRSLGEDWRAESKPWRRLACRVEALAKTGVPSRSLERVSLNGDKARLRPVGLRRGSLRFALRSKRRLVEAAGVECPRSHFAQTLDTRGFPLDFRSLNEVKTMFNTFNKLLLFQRTRTNSTTILPPQFSATDTLPNRTGSVPHPHFVFDRLQPTIKTTKIKPAERQTLAMRRKCVCVGPEFCCGSPGRCLFGRQTH
jgi:hypothetical protein